MTIYNHTKAIYQGRDIYARGNGYLPGIYVVMGWQFPLTPNVAWVVWRLIGVLLGVAILWTGYRALRRTQNGAVPLLCLANLAALSGFSPKWGNPGNLAALALVLAYFLLDLRRPCAAGILLGVGCVLKYPLGLPIILLALAAREIRAFVAAAGVFLALQLVGLGVLWHHHYGPAHVGLGVLKGVSSLGGYNEHGFKRFTEANPYRFQFMHLSPVLNAFGMSRGAANAVAFSGALAGTCLAVGAALKKRQVPFLRACAIISPCILLFTYHRFYDSGILAFPIVLAWSSVGARRWLPWVVILFSVPLFLSVSNILYARIGLPTAWVQLALWARVVGPHHVYALAVVALATAVLAFRELPAGNSRDGEQKPGCNPGS